MEKSKLDEFLEIFRDKGLFTHPTLDNAYHAYMEERKTQPQPGQEIEVRDTIHENWMKRKFVAFCPSGEVVAYDHEGGRHSYSWKEYRIPTPKKKYKVVKGEGDPFVVPESDSIKLPIITTFEV